MKSSAITSFHRDQIWCISNRMALIYFKITIVSIAEVKVIILLEIKGCITRFSKNSHFNQINKFNRTLIKMRQKWPIHQWDHLWQNHTVTRRNQSTIDSHQIVKSVEAAHATVEAVKEDIVRVKKWIRITYFKLNIYRDWNKNNKENKWKSKWSKTSYPNYLIFLR